jgi:AcrR family transcriptional regulator
MARPTTISDEKILNVARAVFLEHGFAATTAEVARAAGVAEGSIFKRWKTKQELFLAAMKPAGDVPEFMRDLAARVGHGDVCDTLTEMATQGIEFFKQLLPMAMMMWSNPSTNGLPAHLDVPNSGPVRGLKALAGYFEAEMKKGRMARRDPEVLARTFLGAIQHYAFLDLLDRNRAELPLPAPMFVRGLVHLIWNGVAPGAPPTNGKRGKERVR